MGWRVSFCLALAALTLAEARAAETDDADAFAESVATCVRTNAAMVDARKFCLKNVAIIRIHSELQSAASDRLYDGFEEDYPALDKDEHGRLIVVAKHWKDFPRPGPESREYMLLLMKPHASPQPPTKIVARLRRARDQSIQGQIGHFLEGRIDIERDVEALHGLDDRAFYAALKKKAPTQAFLNVLALEEMTADLATCPALLDAVARLARVKIPLPAQLRTPQTSQKIERLVLHPRIVVLRVPDYPIELSIADASMDTDVYRWVDASARALEPCCRPLSEGQQPPAQR